MRGSRTVCVEPELRPKPGHGIAERAHQMYRVPHGQRRQAILEDQTGDVEKHLGVAHSPAQRLGVRRAARRVVTEGGQGDGFGGPVREDALGLGGREGRRARRQRLGALDQVGQRGLAYVGAKRDRSLQQCRRVVGVICKSHMGRIRARAQQARTVSMRAHPLRHTSAAMTRQLHMACRADQAATLSRAAERRVATARRLPRAPARYPGSGLFLSTMTRRTEGNQTASE